MESRIKDALAFDFYVDRIMNLHKIGFTHALYIAKHIIKSIKGHGLDTLDPKTANKYIYSYVDTWIEHGAQIGEQSRFSHFM